MKKTILFMLLTAAFSTLITSCGSKEEKVVLNKGTAIIENGKGMLDTIPYECTGCTENLSYDMFEVLKRESSTLAKNNLNNPLSFKPVSMDIVIIKEDSLFRFSDGQKIDSALTIINTYTYIGKNAFGVELSGQQSLSFTFVGDIIVDISEDVRLDSLKFEGAYINRSLSLRDSEGFIEVIPTKDRSIIVNSSITCPDEGTWFLITLENDEEIKLVSWNGFNCSGKSYFQWFSDQQISKLKSNRIKNLTVVDKSGVSIDIPKNKSDYFQQLISIR
jgi:hypothetical protein